jgi:hypothetical protein
MISPTIVVIDANKERTQTRREKSEYRALYPRLGVQELPLRK